MKCLRAILGPTAFMRTHDNSLCCYPWETANEHAMQTGYWPIKCKAYLPWTFGLFLRLRTQSHIRYNIVQRIRRLTQDLVHDMTCCYGFLTAPYLQPFTPPCKMRRASPIHLPVLNRVRPRRVHCMHKETTDTDMPVPPSEANTLACDSNVNLLSYP